MKQVNRHLFEGQAEILLPHIRFFYFFLVLLPIKQKNHVQQMMSCIIYQSSQWENTLSEKTFKLNIFLLFFFFSVLQLSSSVDSNSFFGPGEFKKADTRR